MDQKQNNNLKVNKYNNNLYNKYRVQQIQDTKLHYVNILILLKVAVMEKNVNLPTVQVN